jgi:hypothetical protein
MSVNIFYDKLYTGSYIYYDDTFVRTMNFFGNLEDSILNQFINLLFAPNNESIIYFKQKTILGFIIITGNFHDFDDMLKMCNGENYNTFIDIITQQLFNEKNVWMYQEYFCVNYQNMKIPSKINCKIKNIEEQEYDITDKKLRNKIKQERNAITNNRNKINSEIKEKITEFISLYINIDKKTANNIINYYILCMLKSYQSDKYNLNLLFSEKKKLTRNEKLNQMWYFKFTNKDTNFKILPYLTLFRHNFGGIEKQFSTCGETTLLNLLNYCLIQPDSTFDTSNIKNNDIIEFYRTKTMEYIHKNIHYVMHEWLDIISTINHEGIKIYNTTGDIHNNIKNIAYIMNKIIYDKEEIIEERSAESFIINTIKYMNNTIKCKIKNSSLNSIVIILNDYYELFFYPGHGEMKNIMFLDKPEGTNYYMNFVDLNDYSEYSGLFDFNIIYTLFYEIINNKTHDGELMDYNSSLSSIILKYFSKYIINEYNVDGIKDIIYTFLSSVKIYHEYIDFTEDIYDGGSSDYDDSDDDDYYEDNDDDDYYENNEYKFLKRDPKYDDEKKKLNDIILQNLPNLTDLTLYYSYSNDFFEYLSVCCKQLKKLEIVWAKINLSMKSISKNTNLESFVMYETNSKLKLTNFEYLNDLVNLSDLYLELNNVEIFPELNLPKLLKLELHISSVKELGEFYFPKLIECSFSNNDKIVDISFLRNSKHLKKLNSYITSIENYSFLESLKDLEDLRISSRKNINDIKFDNLKKLKSLEINVDNFDLNIISKNTELTKLNISKANIIDINPLKNLINLENIDLSKNPIEDLSPLLSINNIKYLSLGTFNYPNFSIVLKEKISPDVRNLLDKHKILYTISSKSSKKSSPKSSKKSPKSSKKSSPKSSKKSPKSSKKSSPKSSKKSPKSSKKSPKSSKKSPK